jgi:hypothetical protein
MQGEQIISSIQWLPENSGIIIGIQLQIKKFPLTFHNYDEESIISVLF